MRVYLDNCCYNRPFDDQTQLKVRLETEAKLFVQGLMRTGAQWSMRGATCWTRKPLTTLFRCVG